MTLSAQYFGADLFVTHTHIIHLVLFRLLHKYHIQSATDKNIYLPSRRVQVKCKIQVVKRDWLWVLTVFWISVRSVVYQQNSKESATLQPFFTLQLDIQSEKIRTVQEALETLVARESVQGYTTKTKQEVWNTCAVLVSFFVCVLCFSRSLVCPRYHGNRALEWRFPFLGVVN